MSELPPINPVDRVYYSSNPHNMNGAHERADIEAIMQPAVVAAFDVLDDTKLTGPKYRSTDAAIEQLAKLKVLKPFLDPERSQNITRRISAFHNVLGTRVQKEEMREEQTQFRQSLNEDLKDAPAGSAIVITRHYMNMESSKDEQQKHIRTIEKMVSDAYAKDPTMVFDMWATLGKMRDELGPEDEERRIELKRVEREFVNILAKQPFPIRTGDDTKDIELFEQLDYQKMFTYGAHDVDPHTADAPAAGSPRMQGFNIGLPNKDEPLAPLAAAVWMQFLQHAQTSKSPTDTMRRFDAIFERSLEHVGSDGAKNLLSLTAMSFLDHRQIQKIMRATGIQAPAQTFSPERYFKPIQLLFRASVRDYFTNPKAFDQAEGINRAVMRSSGLTLDSLIKTLERVDDQFGTNLYDEARSLEHKAITLISNTPADDPIHTKRLQNNAHYRRRTAEVRYDRGFWVDIPDMLLSPQDTFSRSIFTERNEVDPLQRMREHYQSPNTSETLSHPGYFATVAQLLKTDFTAEHYAEMRDQIESMQLEILIDGNHFISPVGDQFIVDDKALRAAGMRHITFTKQPDDRKFLRTDIRFENTTIGCVITPDMELQTVDGKPLNLPENLTEPLQYLMFGYLHAIKCQPEKVTETSSGSKEDTRTAESVVRRAHMRRLQDGHNPSPEQIDLALTDDDFDVIADNKDRITAGLPPRTYVGQTLINAENAPPNILRAQSVTNNFNRVFA